MTIAASLLRLLAGSPLAGIPGGPEIWVILFIILILFGRRLPGVARSLGQGISSFKKGLNEPLDEDDAEAEAEEKARAKGSAKIEAKATETSAEKSTSE